MFEGSHGQSFHGNVKCTLLPTDHLIIVTNADNIGQIKNVYIFLVATLAYSVRSKHNKTLHKMLCYNYLKHLGVPI